MRLMKNKRGAALMQVLLVTAILAGIATFILRASLSRTSNARRARRTISAHLLIESCMAEVNALWSAKNPEAFFRDMDECIMYCKNTDATSECSESNKVSDYTCTIPDPEAGNNKTYKVVASMVSPETELGKCQITYNIKDEAGHSVL